MTEVHHGLEGIVAFATEIAEPEVTARLGSGTVDPLDVDAAELAATEPERLEGMLVRIRGTFTVADRAVPDLRGQWLLSTRGRLVQRVQMSPPAAGLAEISPWRAPGFLVLDSGISGEVREEGTPSPDDRVALQAVRLGDTVSDPVGIVDYGSVRPARGPVAVQTYRLQFVRPLQITRSNPRPAAPARSSQAVRVVSFNAYNYFTSFPDGRAAGLPRHPCLPSDRRSDCRGARSQEQFERQTEKLVQALADLDADVFVLQEMQRNGGASVRHLAAALNRHVGELRYAARNPPESGTGTDAIEVALIYRLASLDPVGPALSDSDPVHHRAPVAQTFRTTAGFSFTIVGVHFKSKLCEGAGPSDVDAGDGQGCYADRRERQVAALLRFISGLPRRTTGGSVLALGDFNAYACERALERLRMAELRDALPLDQRAENYSHVHDARGGTLDHAFASAALADRIVAAQHWHINADEPALLDYRHLAPGMNEEAGPWRSSDHDPLVVDVRNAPSPAAGSSLALPVPRCDTAAAANERARTPSMLGAFHR